MKFRRRIKFFLQRQLFRPILNFVILSMLLIGCTKSSEPIKIPESFPNIDILVRALKDHGIQCPNFVSEHVTDGRCGEVIHMSLYESSDEALDMGESTVAVLSGIHSKCTYIVLKNALIRVDGQSSVVAKLEDLKPLLLQCR